MKFLENDKLAELTAILTDTTIGTGDRAINGRIEAFSMKRAGTDKKYALALGEKYQHEINVVETEIAQLRDTIERTAQNTSNASTPTSSRGSSRSPPSSKGSSSSSSKGKSALHVPKKKSNSSFVKRGGKGRQRSQSLNVTFSSDLPKEPSAKRSRSDSADLTNKIISSCSPNMPYSNSPLGNFNDSCTRRLMTDLILTLNASFPDYDFSSVRPSHFARIPTSTIAMNRTNEKLSELAATTDIGGGGGDGGVTFLTKLWNAIDDVINLSESEVYSYVPPTGDDDDDPLSFLTQTLESDLSSTVPLWTFNFFFVNKALKRIVLFTCVQTMRNEIVNISSGAEEDVDEEVRESSMLYHDHGYRLQGIGREGLIERGYSSGYGDEDEENENYADYDMDEDGMGQAVSVPSAPVH